MESSSTLSYMLRNAELPCNQVSLGLSDYNQHHHHSPLWSPSFSPTIFPGFEPTYLWWQEVHATFRPEEKPGRMPPSSAINFGPVVDGYGSAPAMSGYDIPSHIFTDEKLSQDPKPLSPHRQTQDVSSIARILLRNGGVTDKEKPGRMLPNSAINFGPLVDDCGGAPAIAGHDLPSHIFTDEKLSQMYSQDPKPLSPHRQTQDGSSTARMIASLIRNGGVGITDIPHLDMVRILNNKWGFLTHDAGLTVDISKGGLAINQGVHASALPMEPEFTKRAYLTKQASFSSSSELAQVAAYNPVRGDEGSHLHGLGKVESHANLKEMPNGLDTSECPPCNSPNGCYVSQANLGRMSSGLDTPVCLPGNIVSAVLELGTTKLPAFICNRIGHEGTLQQAVTISPYVHGVSQIKEEHTRFDAHPSFSPVSFNDDTGEGTQKLCISSIRESDENYGLEASSHCEQNGGRGSTGKNKRIKDGLKDSTARVLNLKDLDTDEVEKGKRYKSGECTSEENQKVEQSTSANSNDSTPTSGKESSKPPETSKPDYIHVRARRGQATDSHSLAERVRREKISERMKFLQDLVPGCSKVTGKALMLDEIINYVQSLQRQVEFLSMKLAAVNPRLEFHMDDLSSGIQMIQPEVPHHESLVISAENTTSYLPFLHHHQHPQQMVTPCPPVNVQSLRGLDMEVSTSVASMEAYGDAIAQVTRAWDQELQHVGQLLFYQGRPAPSTLSSLQDHPCFNGQMKVEL